MGQEVNDIRENWTDGPSSSDSLAIVPVEDASSSIDMSVGLRGGHSYDDTLKISFIDGHDEAENLVAGRSSSKRGLTGLQNLGNTCFMNSALQCLAHTPELVEYFLQDYSKEINQSNPLGMKGELAEAFGELIRNLWSGKDVVAPRSFKGILSRFAPQFSGYNQHDSQELLAFLLDGLHEDLNRVKSKPYLEVKDADARPDEEVAEEYWANHKARNDSIIVDLFQGQYKSTLVCPSCNKVSVTFDPFMYLSLPLPEMQMMNITVTVFSGDGSARPEPHTVNIRRQGKMKDVCDALASACKLSKDEHLFLLEVYQNRIYQTFDESVLISSLNPGDRLAAFRLPTDCKSPSSTLVIYHGQTEKLMYSNRSVSLCGSPFVAPLPNEGITTGRELYELVLKTISPLKQDKDLEMSESQAEDVEWPFDMYTTDDKGATAIMKIDPGALLPEGVNEVKYVVLDWSKKGLEEYNIRSFTLPQALNPKNKPEPVSLYACLEAFMKEEPLGPEDMWFCPNCKEHRQASKKLDLWRLPEILVIHLKRFSYSRFWKNKLETLVDFPVHDLDLNKYVSGSSDHYELYAVSNHYGGMGGGHYTAYAKVYNENNWFYFDDSHVSQKSETDEVKTSAAYVLFYRRKKRISNGGPAAISEGVSSLGMV